MIARAVQRRNKQKPIRPELPFEFAKLASGDEKTALQFVTHYGLLGYREAADSSLELFRRFEFLATTPRGEDDEPPPVSELPDFFHPGFKSGDPLSWVFLHAQTVKFVLDLYGSLKDKHKLKVLLDTLVTQNERGEKLLRWDYAARGELYRKQMVIVNPPEEDPVESARYIIAWIINENLRGGVSRELIVDTDLRRQDRKRTVQSVFQAESLIDCIYWHLADAISGNTIKRCLFCGRFFTATTLKRMYCPPPMGYEGDGPCAQNDRARRYRMKDKQPKGIESKGKRNGRQRPRKTKG